MATQAPDTFGPVVMDDSTRVFMPLRSNAAWFGDADCRERLERQIKTYLVLYDHIIFENGRYRITAGVDGQGIEMMCPGDSYPGDRSKISFFPPGDEFGVEFGGKQLLSSTSQSAYEVDYLPIVRDAGLEHAGCVRWSDNDIKPEFKNAITQRVSQDLHGKALHDVLPENSYLRKHILEALYRDSLGLKRGRGVETGTQLVVDVQAMKTHEVALSDPGQRSAGGGTGTFIFVTPRGVEKRGRHGGGDRKHCRSTCLPGGTGRQAASGTRAGRLKVCAETHYA